MKKIIMAMLLGASIVTANAAFAADKKTEIKAPTREQREKMADAHQKMADCLRSDKPMSECKQQMMKSCHDMMAKDGGCPMMGDMHDHMKGMMGGETPSENHEAHHPSGE